MSLTNKYVDWFVNRERQHRGFLQMLAGQTRKRIMLIVAPADMGKTWLIQRMLHDCSIQSIPVVKFNFRDGIGRDTLELVRKARDELGAGYYNHLTQVINELTGGRRINIEQVNLTISDSTLTDTAVTVDDRSAEVAGRVTDNFDFVRVNSEQMQALIHARINDAFFACLAKQSAVQSIAFLFDSYEDALPEAVHWVENELLPRVHDGSLANTTVVLASRSAPTLSESIADGVATTDLPGFNEEHIREYIERRNARAILDKHENFIQLVLDINAHNQPKMLARIVDGYLNTRAEEEDDDWLL